MTDLQFILLTAVATAVATRLLDPLRFLPQAVKWLVNRLRQRVRVVVRMVDAEEGKVEVAVENASGHTVDVQDVRLVFAGDYGIPASMKDEHLLPTTILHDQTLAWNFSVPDIRKWVLSLAAPNVAARGVVTLRPRITLSDGKVYRAASFNVELDEEQSRRYRRRLLLRMAASAPLLFIILAIYLWWFVRVIGTS